MTNEPDEDYTVEELLAMDDFAFGDAVTEDLEHTGHHQSPFQDDRVIKRTMTALLDKVWFTAETLAKHADDPDYPIDKWNGTLSFRRYLLSVVDITERRIEWAQGPNARQLSAWKTALNTVLDEIEGTAQDWILDDFRIPFDNLSFRDWIAIRRAKQPNRAPKREVAA